MAKIDPNKLEELKHRYLDGGESLKDLAETIGCSQPTMSRFLRKNGVAVRGKGRVATKQKPEERVAKIVPSVSLSESSQQLDEFRRKILGDIEKPMNLTNPTQE